MQLDPTKPITDDLRRRGFGYDIMGLLLAHCQQDVAQDVMQKCALYDRGKRITTAQAQKLIDFILHKYDFSYCSSCDAMECWQERVEPRFSYCVWCQDDYCSGCQTFDKICRDCDACEWCATCGNECMRARDATCDDCKQKVCTTSVHWIENDYHTCSRCYLREAEDNGLWPYGSTHEKDVTLCKESIRAVMARRGIVEHATP
jgi:hypothetical protein